MANFPPNHVHLLSVSGCLVGHVKWAYLGGRVDKGPLKKSVLVILWCYSGRFGVLFLTRDDGRLLREVCTSLEHVDLSEKCVRFLKISTSARSVYDS